MFYLHVYCQISANSNTMEAYTADLVHIQTKNLIKYKINQILQMNRQNITCETQAAYKSDFYNDTNKTRLGCILHHSMTHQTSMQRPRSSQTRARVSATSASVADENHL